MNRSLQLMNVAGLALLAGALVVPGMSAQTAASNTAPAAMQNGKDVTRGEVASFDKFLDSHKEVAEALKAHPGLIRNQDFVEKHPELKEYLGQHPAVREEVREHPKRFMHREKGFEHHEKRGDDGGHHRGHRHH